MARPLIAKVVRGARKASSTIGNDRAREVAQVADRHAVGGHARALVVVGRQVRRHGLIGRLEDRARA